MIVNTHMHPRYHHHHHSTELVCTSRNFLVTLYFFFFAISFLFLCTGRELYPSIMFQSRHFCVVSDRHSVTSGLENVSTWCDCNFVTLQSQCPVLCPWPLETALLFSASTLDVSGRGIVQYFSCDSLTSGSLMASKLIHTVVNKISSFPRLQDITVHVFLLFCSVSGHWACFCVLAVVNVGCRHPFEILIVVLLG